MISRDIIARTWQGEHLAVNILFSSAGIAQQIAISNDNGWLLVDCGDGTLRDLRENKIDRRKLAGMIFTHGHFDHMGGLLTLMGYLRMIGRKDILPILIPAGCEEVVGVIRNFEQNYGDSIPFESNLIEGQAEENYEMAGMIITPYETFHCGSIEGAAVLGRIPSFGYRISCKEESVAVSGDTGDCPGLRKLVGGVDLAIIEATYDQSSDASPEELEKVHLSEDLAAEIGSAAREYILVHRGRR